MNKLLKLVVFSSFMFGACVANEITVNDEVFEVIISEDAIQQRVKNLGAQISADYQGSTPVFIGVLTGGAFFVVDLVREVTIPCETRFIKVSSYENAQVSSGKVKLQADLTGSLAGRDVIIVEDIIDTGYTIQFVRDYILTKNPKSVKIASLTRKNNSLKIEPDFAFDYIGFEVPKRFLIGCGLDYKQTHRNLKSIYAKV